MVPLKLLTAIILTYNEEQHLERCIKSVKDICDRIIVVDSGSIDSTEAICIKLGALFFYNKWVNYASQFNFGMHLARSMGATWCLRIDADEYVADFCPHEIRKSLGCKAGYNGFYVDRSMYFLRRSVKYGAMFPRKMLRIFNVNKATIESSWMDEHIIVDGPVRSIDMSIIDDNFNSLAWWKNKHIDYAKREVIDVYKKKLMNSKLMEANISFERSVKDRIYLRLPLLIRPFVYFFYRYILFGGFLDGPISRNFHFWQGLWYRIIVDCFILKVKYEILMGASLPKALIKVTGKQIDFTKK